MTPYAAVVLCRCGLLPSWPYMPLWPYAIVTLYAVTTLCPYDPIYLYGHMPVWPYALMALKLNGHKISPFIDARWSLLSPWPYRHLIAFSFLYRMATELSATRSSGQWLELRCPWSELVPLSISISISISVCSRTSQMLNFFRHKRCVELSVKMLMSYRLFGPF